MASSVLGTSFLSSASSIKSQNFYGEKVQSSVLTRVAQAPTRKVTEMKKAVVGTVVSTKMGKTAVISVERQKLHPLYKKTYKQSKNYVAHDEDNVCEVGQKVILEPSNRRMSKTKRWLVKEVCSNTGCTPSS